MLDQLRVVRIAGPVVQFRFQLGRVQDIQLRLEGVELHLVRVHLGNHLRLVLDQLRVVRIAGLVVQLRLETPRVQDIELALQGV